MSDSPVAKYIVQLLADNAQFVAAFEQAKRKAQDSSKDIESSFEGVLSNIKGKLVGIAGALGVTLGVGAFVGMVKDAIDAEAELGRLGERAGLTGSQLSQFTHAAALSHTPLEDVAQMSARVSKALLDMGNDNAKSTIVLKALGINAGDAARLLADPAQAAFELSKRLNELPEGGTKAAAQLLLVGRAGGTTSALMKELAAQTDLVATKTDVQVAAAKRLEDSFTELGLSSAATKASIANAFLPTIQDIVTAYATWQKSGTDLKTSIDKLSTTAEFHTFGQDVALTAASAADGVIDFAKALALLPAAAKLAGTGLLGLSQELSGYVLLGTGAASSNFVMMARGMQDVRDGFGAMKVAGSDFADEILKITNRTTVYDVMQKQFADRLNGTGFAGGSADAVQRRIDTAKANEKRLQDALNSGNRTTAGGGGDILKKVLDNQLAELNASVDGEKQTLTARGEYLQAYYSAGDISLKEFYEKRDESITEGLAFDEKAFDESIRVVQDYVRNRLGELAKLTSSGAIKPDQAAKEGAAAQEDATKRVIEINKKRESAEQEAARKSTKDWFDNRGAITEYGKSIQSVVADIVELEGRTADAAKIRIGQAADDARKKSTGDPAGLAIIDTRERLLNIQADLNESQTKFGEITQRVSLLDAGVDLKVQQGLETEIDGINEKTRLHEQFIPLLEQEAARYEALAAKASDPKFALAAANLRLQIAQIASQSDELAKKFRDGFEGGFATFLSDIEGRQKTIKQALADLGSSLTKTISDEANKQLAQAVLGKNGPLGSIPDFIAGLFGGKKGAPDAPTPGWVSGQDLPGGADLASSATSAASTTASAAAMDAFNVSLLATTPVLDALTLSTTLASPAFDVVTLSATAAAAALDAMAIAAAASAATSAASSAGTALAAAAAALPGLATGTDYWKGGPVIVGEKGKEVVNLARGSKVTPNDKLGGNTIHQHANITINVPPTTSGATASQLAIVAARKIQQAQRRFGQ